MTDKPERLVYRDEDGEWEPVTGGDLLELAFEFAGLLILLLAVYAAAISWVAGS